METNRIRRQQSTGIPLPPQSPGLFRSRSRSSVGAAITDNKSCSPNSNANSHIVRSKSVTARSRSKKDEDNVNHSNNQKKKVDHREMKDGFVNFLQRKTGGGCKGAIKSSSPVSSPSAWALSPGRSLGAMLTPPPPPPEAAAMEGGRGGKSCRDRGGGVSSVLKYFRQKKSSSSSAAAEEELHRFRILQNRLLHWRFANQRADKAMAKFKTHAEKRLFSLWLHNVGMRNRIVEKRVQVQKVRNDIKLHRIIFLQMTQLNKWAKLDKRNQESVCHVASLLSSLTLRLPLIQGAKTNIVDFQQAMSFASEIIDQIEASITKHTSKEMEKVLYMVTERLSIFKEQEEGLEKLEKAICLVTTLVEKENTLRVQLIRATENERISTDA